MNRYTIIYEQEDGGYTGKCVELPGAISEGDTFEEFKANMQEAVELALEFYQEHPEYKNKKQILQITVGHYIISKY